MKEPKEAPAPGKTPAKKPNNVLLIIEGTVLIIVASFGMIFPITGLSLSFLTFFVLSIKTNTSETANIPTITTRKSIPSYKSISP